MLVESVITALVALSMLPACILALPVHVAQDARRTSSTVRHDTTLSQAKQSAVSLANMGADGNNFGFAIGSALAKLSNKETWRVELPKTPTKDQWTNFLKACNEERHCTVVDKKMQPVDSADIEKSAMSMISSWEWQSNLREAPGGTINLHIDASRFVLETGFCVLLGC